MQGSAETETTVAEEEAGATRRRGASTGGDAAVPHEKGREEAAPLCPTLDPLPAREEAAPPRLASNPPMELRRAGVDRADREREGAARRRRKGGAPTKKGRRSVGRHLASRRRARPLASAAGEEGPAGSHRTSSTAAREAGHRRARLLRRRCRSPVHCREGAPAVHARRDRASGSPPPGSKGRRRVLD
jgi:hypothetical protein